MSATDQALKTSYTLPVPQWYNPATGVWEEATGSAALGGFVQSADGAQATVGAKADTAATASTGSSSLVALLKGILAQLLGAPTLTNKSVAGTGAAVVAIAANASRKYLLIQSPDGNLSDSWVSLVGTASAASPSMQIKKNGGGFEWSAPGRVPGNALSVLVQSGDSLTIWEG
jgi:hypothetical protein